MSNTLALAETENFEEMIQEFFLSETVYPQEKGEMQLTLSPSHQREKTQKLTQTVLTFEYGFTDRFQVEVESPYLWLDKKGKNPENGFGDVEIGFLYNLSNNNRPAAFSIGVEVALPSGDEDKGLGEGETETEVVGILAKEWGGTQLHLNAGVEIEDDETGFVSNLAGVANLGIWRPTLELNGLGGKSKDRFVTPGIVTRIIDDLEIGLGFPLRLTADGPKDVIILKATIEFEGVDNEDEN